MVSRSGMLALIGLCEDPTEATRLTCTPAGPLALRPRLTTGVLFLAESAR